MRIIRLHALFFISALVFIPSLVAQESRMTQDSAAYNWFDKMVGIGNSGILNGPEYIEQHVTVNEQQKYFSDIYFSPGSVVYNGQPYYNIEMKYNVFNDLLLLRGTGTNPLQLHKNRIKEFNLKGTHFINISADTTAPVNGFHEVLLQTETLSLLKKHTKKLKKFLDRSFTYFEFYDDIPLYAIEYREEYLPVNSRRQLIQAFPEYAAPIRQFYRERRSEARNNPDLFMTNLAKNLGQLLSSNILKE